MPRIHILTLLLVTAGLSASAKTPVLVELFTSEGCSDCPPADQLLARLDEKQPEADAELIVLSEHVDYFNSLGWKDPFSAALFTARQESIAKRLHSDDVYTPEMVVDGRFGFVGSDASAASAAIRKAVREPKIPVAISDVARSQGRLTVRVEASSRGALYVALADERDESRVARGENGGRTLKHVAVVRVLRSAGAIDPGKSSTEVTIPIQPDWGANGLRVIAFVQDPASGYVIGASERRIAH